MKSKFKNLQILNDQKIFKLSRDKNWFFFSSWPNPGHVVTLGMALDVEQTVTVEKNSNKTKCYLVSFDCNN